MTEESAKRQDRYKLFVLMPFREQFDDIYLVIKDAAKTASEALHVTITCLRADELGPSRITEQIIEAIRDADLLVVELSDVNPNVMYELGLAHSLGKPAIIITQDVSMNTFDLRAFPMILYDRARLVKDLRASLIASITRVIEGDLQGLTGAYGPLPTADREPPKVDRSRVFISYSHADSDILKRVLIHLKPLEKQGVIDLWVDTRVKAGEKWEDRVKGALASAKVAILLISADFLASDFIVENELPPLLSAAEQEGTKIIPVIVKPSRFLRDKNLAAFQALNDPARPVMKMDAVEQEELLVRLAEIVEFYHK